MAIKSNVFDNEIYIPGCTLSRNDWDGRVGGGTFAYIRDGLPYSTRSDLEAPNIEACVIEINRVKARKNFIFTQAPDKKLEHFVESLSNVLRTVPSESNITILGDFNVNILAAKKDSIKGLVSGSCIAGFCYCLHFTPIQQIAIKIPCFVHF